MFALSAQREAVLCDKAFPRSCNTRPPSPDRELTTDLKYGRCKVQLGEPVGFIGVSYRNVGEGLRTGAQMTQRQLCHQVPPQHGWQLTTAGKSGAHCTACRQLSGLESAFSKWLWPKPLLGNWSELSIFTALLPWAFSWQLSMSGSFQYLLCQGEPGQCIWSVSGTSCSYFELFAFLSKELSCWMGWFSLRGTFHRFPIEAMGSKTYKSGSLTLKFPLCYDCCSHSPCVP